MGTGESPSPLSAQGSERPNVGGLHALLTTLGVELDLLALFRDPDGDSIFIPSGRLHAIGEGNLIVEIQQNSDTTYRVFDWNRAGLDGKPRELHIEESLLSTDFADFAPPLDHVASGVVAECEHFRVEKKILTASQDLRPPGDFALVTVVGGEARCGEQTFTPGDFFLLPASGTSTVAPAHSECTALVTTIP